MRLKPYSFHVDDLVLELRAPGSIPLDMQTTVEFRAFLQQMLNRRCVGALRYGDQPKVRQRYMTRLARELKAYRKTGNIEQLLNIAVYAFLESVAPEHRHQHWDATVDSVTRKEMGGDV